MNLQGSIIFLCSREPRKKKSKTEENFELTTNIIYPLCKTKSRNPQAQEGVVPSGAIYGFEDLNQTCTK